MTSAPPLVSEFQQFTDAKFFSNNVLPIKSPKPNPIFSLLVVLIDFRYGSPIFDKISLG